MTALRHILALAFFCLALSPAGAQTSPRTIPPVPAQQARQLNLAIEAVEDNRPKQALEMLDSLLTNQPHPLVLHTAALLRGQLTGLFTGRMQTHLRRKVMPVLVLVPDEPALLEALAGWTEDCYYPILIEDGWYTPIFAKRFQPQQILRWSADSSDKPASDFVEVLKNWTEQHNRRLAGSTDRPAPPGLVVIDPADPQRAGGLVLAVGHGQPVYLLEDKTRATTLLSAEAVNRLNEKLTGALLQWKLAQTGQWCGLTLAADLPVRYTADFRGQTKRFAVDDRLGRAANGLRLAVSGRLWGGPAQSVYMAMAALFCPPRRALLFDDYSNRSAGFVAYRLEQARRILQPRLPVQHITGDQTNPLLFRRLTRDGQPFDLLWINSHGSSHNFNIRGQALSDDLPMDQAVAVYMVHSYSAASPWSYNNLAGRAMRGGAFWFFGSVDEPYLHAFARPTGMSLKMAAGTPLAMAARHLPGRPMSQPWKLMTFGDPLYALRHPPAPRLPVAPIAHTKPLQAPPPSTDLAGAFHHAVLTGHDRAIDLAGRILAHPTQHDRSDVDRAAWLLWSEGQYQKLAVLKPQQVGEALVARWTVWDSALKMFDKSCKAGSVRACQLLLERLLAIGWWQQPLDRCLERWMELAGSQAACRAFLRKQAAGKLPYYSRKAVEAALSHLERSG